MDPTDLILLVTIVTLVGSATFLAIAETALVRTGRARAEALMRSRRRGARQLARLTEHPERFLNPILLLVLVCQLVAATLVGVLAGRHFGGAGVAAVTTAEVVVVFIAAEAAPKTWAVRHPDQAALLVAPVVGLLLRFWPVRLLTDALIGLADLMLPGRGLPPSPSVSEADLRAMADLAGRERVIEPEEQTLIKAVLAFGDRIVREIMVPRIDMATIPASATLDDAHGRALSTGHSRFPISADAADDVVGLFNAKDLLTVDPTTWAERTVTEVTRDAHFVPETKRIADLLTEMQEGQMHMVMVTDEFGATAGLVTMEDVIEELVGEIRDEYDLEEPPIQPLPEGLRVHGGLAVDELNAVLGADFPRGEWDTVGGLVLGLLGHIPEEGERLEADGYRIIVERCTDQRVRSVLISPLAAPSPTDPPR